MNIPGFEIKEKTGGNGSISTYRAMQLSLKRMVFLKVLDPKLASVKEIDSFICEGRTAAHFKHPNSVEIFDINSSEEGYYIAMEHIPGRTLRQMVQSSGPFPPTRALKMAAGVAEALNAAWDQTHLAHREVTPDNIIISDEGRIKLSGFGQARRPVTTTPDNPQSAGPDAGNLHFLSPEQSDGNTISVDIKSDMYSLGATLYFAITGMVPFGTCQPAEALKKHATDKLTHPKNILSSIPANICQIITKLMMKSPAERYPDWNSVLADIKKAGTSHVISMPPGWETGSSIAPMTDVPVAAALPISGSTRSSFDTWMRIPVWLAIVLSWILLACCLLRPMIEQKIRKLKSAATTESTPDPDPQTTESAPDPAPETAELSVDEPPATE